jgi:hypothetical protein
MVSGLYPNGSILSVNRMEAGLHPDPCDFIGKMPVGATFFDQIIFPYLDGYPVNFKNLSHDMTRVSWGGFGFPPFDRINEDDSGKSSELH